jgi:hypothetical protein
LRGLSPSSAFSAEQRGNGLKVLPIDKRRSPGYLLLEGDNSAGGVSDRAARWGNDEIQVRALMEATFWPNPVKDSAFRYRATHLDGKRAPKVVLCDDVRIRPGVPCQVSRR